MLVQASQFDAGCLNARDTCCAQRASHSDGAAHRLPFGKEALPMQASPRALANGDKGVSRDELNAIVHERVTGLCAKLEEVLEERWETKQAQLKGKVEKLMKACFGNTLGYEGEHAGCTVHEKHEKLEMKLVSVEKNHKMVAEKAQKLEDSHWKHRQTAEQREGATSARINRLEVMLAAFKGGRGDFSKPAAGVVSIDDFAKSKENTGPAPTPSKMMSENRVEDSFVPEIKAQGTAFQGLMSTAPLASSSNSMLDSALPEKLPMTFGKGAELPGPQVKDTVTPASGSDAAARSKWEDSVLSRLDMLSSGYSGFEKRHQKSEKDVSDLQDNVSELGRSLIELHKDDLYKVMGNIGSKEASKPKAARGEQKSSTQQLAADSDAKVGQAPNGRGAGLDASGVKIDVKQGAGVGLDVHLDDAVKDDSSKVEQLEELRSAGTRGYVLKPSAYDASLFIGVPAVGTGGSISITVLLIVTATLQILFCVLGFAIFENPFGDHMISGYKTWRTDVASRAGYVDDFTGTSLGSRVCNGNSHGSLEISTTQAHAVHALQAYLGSGSTPTAYGAGLCLLCLFCWFVSLAGELRSLIHFFESVCKIPRKAKALLVLDDGTPTLSQLSSGHVIFMGALLTLRVIVLLMLAVAGTQFLVYTQEISEVVLRLAALHFVLRLDGLLFGLAPDLVHCLLSSLAPLPAPRTLTVAQLQVGFHQFFSWLSLFVFTACAVGLAVWPNWQNRQDALDALCSGDQNVVYGLDKAGAVSWATTGAVSWASSTRKAISDVILGGTAALPIASNMCTRDCSE